jgi:hypothetical protein
LEAVFSLASVPRLYNEDQLQLCQNLNSSAAGSRLVRELQLKGASQREQEPFDTEAKVATPLKAATKQRSEGRD